jgi:hypothetical protein
MFKKYGRRTAVSHLHLWVGRIAITLGMIDGGFGFVLTKTRPTVLYLYGTCAILTWSAYVFCTVVGERRRSASRKRLLEEEAKRIPSWQQIDVENHDGGWELSGINATSPVVAYCEHCKRK